MLFSCNRENNEVLSSNLKSTSVDNLSYTDIDNISDDVCGFHDYFIDYFYNNVYNKNLKCDSETLLYIKDLAIEKVKTILLST